jgi:nucleoside-diphosphate-sugar epimerase
MNIAVTGANGFIGKHVVAELQHRSLPATLVMRTADRVQHFSSTDNIAILDLANPPVDAYQLMGCPDTLIHLAWGGLPNYNSLHHFEEELPTQYQFLKMLVKSGLKNLLVAGTCFEYGMQSGLLTEETIARPTNPYGFAKDTLRCQLEYLQQIVPFNLTWTRLFYVYGKGQTENSLLIQLTRASERGDKVFNMSGGEQLRDFISVSEVAKHLVSLATMIRPQGVINVCSGKPISVRRLVENWIAENNWSIDLNLGYYPYPSHEPMAFWGDRQKLDRCLEVQYPKYEPMTLLVDNRQFDHYVEAKNLILSE